MPVMLVRQTVADFTAWKRIFAEHEMTRRANGSLGGRILRNADNPTEVLILLEWDGLERARLFADSDDLREVMMWAGISDWPDIWFLEEVGSSLA